MKVKVGKLLQMKPVIEKIVTKDIDIDIAWDLMKVVKAFDAELDLYAKSRLKIFNRFAEEPKEDATPEEKKKGKVIPKEKREDFAKEIEKLLDKEIKLEVKKIKLSSLKANGIKLSTGNVMAIELISEK